MTKLMEGTESPLFSYLQIIITESKYYRMDLKRKIEEIVLKKLDKDDVFLVDVIISGTEIAQKILVLIDGDQGIDIETCAKISRGLGEEIEELDLISNAFVLEVSSPGLDHPLQNMRQYRKNVGRMVKISLINDKIIRGKLLEVQDEKLKIGEEKKSKVKGKPSEYSELELPINEIKKTNVLASFK